MNRYHLNSTHFFITLWDLHFSSLTAQFDCSPSCSWPFIVSSDWGDGTWYRYVTWSFGQLLYDYFFIFPANMVSIFFCLSSFDAALISPSLSISWYDSIIIIIITSQMFIYSISSSSTQHFFIELERTKYKVTFYWWCLYDLHIFHQ